MPTYPLSHGHCSALSRMNKATRYVLEDFLRNYSEADVMEACQQWLDTNDLHARRHFARALMEDYFAHNINWDEEARLVQRACLAMLRRVQWRVLAAALLWRAVHESPNGPSRNACLILRAPYVEQSGVFTEQVSCN